MSSTTSAPTAETTAPQNNVQSTSSLTVSGTVHAAAPTATTTQPAGSTANAAHIDKTPPAESKEFYEKLNILRGTVKKLLDELLRPEIPNITCIAQVMMLLKESCEDAKLRLETFSGFSIKLELIKKRIDEMSRICSLEDMLEDTKDDKALQQKLKKELEEVDEGHLATVNDFGAEKIEDWKDVENITLETYIVEAEKLREYEAKFWNKQNEVTPKIPGIVEAALQKHQFPNMGNVKERLEYEALIMVNNIFTEFTKEKIELMKWSDAGLTTPVSSSTSVLPQLPVPTIHQNQPGTNFAIHLPMNTQNQPGASSYTGVPFLRIGYPRVFNNVYTTTSTIAPNQALNLTTVHSQPPGAPAILQSYLCATAPALSNGMPNVFICRTPPGTLPFGGQPPSNILQLDPNGSNFHRQQSASYRPSIFTVNQTHPRPPTNDDGAGPSTSTN